MECFACDQAATRHCSRCAKAYCPDHGDELCGECLNPLNAAPSSTVFRASLFALLGASVLALWLLVRPPSVPGDEGNIIRPQPTPQITPVATKQPGATQRPGVTVTPGTGEATPTPVAGEPTDAPEVTPEPTPAGPIEYTVEEGDTWFGIAEFFGVDAENLAAVNGFTLDDFLQPGDIIVIPQ